VENREAWVVGEATTLGFVSDIPSIGVPNCSHLTWHLVEMLLLLLLLLTPLGMRAAVALEVAADHASTRPKQIQSQVVDRRI
jgi:hypothetical protein